MARYPCPRWSQDTWQRVQRRLADNKRYAARNSRNPSLLQGICACSSCGYAYYRTSTRTTNKKIYYYRCLGSDDYRYEHGRVCANKPVCADYLDTVVWNHITALLADPALIRSEINKRLEQARTVDPATAQRQRLDAGLAKATTAITRLIGAYQEELISLDELRTRMPELRARQSSLHHQIDALDSQLADREVYLKLADNLEDFLTGLHGKTATATVAERQRVLRLLVKDVLVGPDKITIRHSIPVRHNASSRTDDSPETDSEGEIPPDCQLRSRSHRRPLWGTTISVLQGAIGQLYRRGKPPFHIQQHPRQVGVSSHRFDNQIPRDAVEKLLDIKVDDPVVLPTTRPACPDRIQRRAPRAIAVGVWMKDRLDLFFQPPSYHCLGDPVGHGRHPKDSRAAAMRLGYLHRAHRWRKIRTRRHPMEGRELARWP